MSKSSRVFLSLLFVLAVPAAIYGQYIPRVPYMDPGMQDQDNDRGPRNVDSVPWHVLKSGDTPLGDPLVLYWFPATDGEMHAGELVASHMLKVFSTQCVGMQLIPPNESATIAKWGVGGKQPVALLTSGDKIVARTDADHGVLRVSDVENMVHHELYLRSLALDRQLADARKKAIDGDRSAAISAYESIWQQHCLAPQEGREAQKELRKLGVTVKDAHLRRSK